MSRLVLFSKNMTNVFLSVVMSSFYVPIHSRRVRMRIQRNLLENSKIPKSHMVRQTDNPLGFGYRKLIDSSNLSIHTAACKLRTLMLILLVMIGSSVIGSQMLD